MIDDLENDFPKIKGGKSKQKKITYFPLTLNEKQVLYRILVKRGIDSEDAKERIRNLNQLQTKFNKEQGTNKSLETQIQKQRMAIMEDMSKF